jgi:hypothetical protein
MKGGYRMCTAPVTVGLLYPPTNHTASRRQPWYLDVHQLRPKKHFKWTLKERAILYRLRILEQKSILEIQGFFRKKNNIPIDLCADDSNDKFSRTRIHNQIRMVRGTFNGLCHRCREPLSNADLKRINKKKKEDPSLGLCQACHENTAAYKVAKRQKALKEGICPICNEREVMPGHASCRECLSASHRHRYINGLCGECGKRPLAENSISFCEVCLEEKRKNSKEYRKRMKSN